MMEKIDTFNKFMVGVHGDRVMIARPPTRAITCEEALNLAAYLATMVEILPAAEGAPTFDQVLEAVRNA